MAAFDPYLVWLDIPTHERPVNYYRLLGLRPLENDPHVINAAAARVVAHVSRFQQTEHSAACQSLLAELNAARNCLLDPLRKSAYDSGLGQGASSSGERQIGSAPQVPGQANAERQIASSPPVPGAPTPTTRPAPLATGRQPTPQPVAPEQPMPTGVPYSVRPPAALPVNPQSAPTQPAASPAGYSQPEVPMSPIVPMSPVAPTTSQPPAVHQQPPAWAADERTGQVETVIAGQGATAPHVEQPKSGRGSQSRKMRRAQQANSAYMLVGIALAMIVFFFGAVLVLAIYLGG